MAGGTEVGPASTPLVAVPDRADVMERPASHAIPTSALELPVSTTPVPALVPGTTPIPPAAATAGAHGLRILDRITEAFFAVDAEWRFQYVNAGAEPLLRHAPQALLGRVLWEVFPEAIGTVFDREYHRAVAERLTLTFEAYYPPFDAWYHVTAYGAADGLSVFLRDVSQRKLGEARLTVTEAHARRLVSATPNAVYALDLTGAFIEVNPAAQQVLGLSADELLGQPFHRVIAPRSLDQCDALFRRLVAEDAEGTTLEAWVRSVDGHERLLDITLAAMRDGGRLEGYLGVARDITEDRAARLALREREERLREIAATVNEVFWIYTPDFSRTLYMSPAFEQVWGQSVESAYSDARQFLTAVHPDDLPIVLNGMAQVGQVPWLGVEYRVVRPDGTVRWVHTRGYEVSDEAGQVTRVLGTTVDITERKLAELALREKQRELQQILDALPLGVSLVDAAGRQVFFNPALQRFWGEGRPLGPDRYREYVGWRPGTTTRLREEEWPVVRALSGETITAERIDVHAFDGVRKASMVSAVPLRDESGTITGALAVQEDITERQALEERQRLLATVFDNLREGVAVLAMDGRVVYANRQLSEVTGIPPEQLVGLDPRDLAGVSDAAARFPMMLQTTIETGRYAGRVSHQRPRDRQTVPLDVVLSHVPGTHGSRDMIFAVVTDATSDVQREQHLRRAERLASIGTLVAGVAHELNNPLQSILSFTQLLRLGATRSEDAEALAVMQREAERMAKIVADLKQVARTNQTPSTVKSAVDLNEVVQHVCRVQEYRLRTSNVEVVTHSSPALPPLAADRAELEQVVLNLVVNACQAMSERGGGRLTLTTTRAVRGALLQVADTGPGIPADHLERVFDPFFTTKAPGDGTGLGLAVVHGIVSDNGGQIRIESEWGQGTTVLVEWPAASRETRPAPTEVCHRPGPVASGRRVLVVDDEPAIRMVLTHFLQQRGHIVEAAAEGESALRLLGTGQFDVVLSDLRMPGLDGPSLLRRMQAEGCRARVAFMTGDPSGAGSLLSQPGIELLRKPMTLDDVARVVERPGD